MTVVTALPRGRPPRLSGSSPAVHLLGNGRYSVWLTEAGMGRSSWMGQALSRWAGDRIEDADGWRFWLRDPELGRVGPDPLRERSRVTFRLATAGPASVELLDVQGRWLRSLASREFSAGQHALELRRDGLPAGVYWLRLRAAGEARHTRFVVLP